MENKTDLFSDLMGKQEEVICKDRRAYLDEFLKIVSPNGKSVESWVIDEIDKYCKNFLEHFTMYIKVAWIAIIPEFDSILKRKQTIECEREEISSRCVFVEAKDGTLLKPIAYMDSCYCEFPNEGLTKHFFEHMVRSRENNKKEVYVISEAEYRYLLNTHFYFMQYLKSEMEMTMKQQKYIELIEMERELNERENELKKLYKDFVNNLIETYFVSN